MKNLYITLMLLLPLATSCSNADPCYNDREGGYFPIIFNEKLSYHSEAVPYTTWFTGDSVEFEGDYFYVNIKEFDNGQVIEEFWREEDGGVYFYSPEDQKVSMEIHPDHSPGRAWQPHPGAWEYEIVNRNASYSTPDCEFTGLLKLRAEPIGQMQDDRASYYNIYYKKGVGMVAMTVDGEDRIYLLPQSK